MTCHVRGVREIEPLCLVGDGVHGIDFWAKVGVGDESVMVAEVVVYFLDFVLLFFRELLLLLLFVLDLLLADPLEELLSDSSVAVVFWFFRGCR